MRNVHLVIVAATLLVTGTVIAADSTSNRRETYADKYGPLSEHNIFLKDRTVKPKPASQPVSPTVTRAPEEALVFRGAALDADGTELRAYFEDINKSPPEIIKISPGDPIARGKIAEIQIDAVGYERNGQLVWIDIGADLTGKQVVVVTSESTHSTPTSGPAEAIDPNDPNLTMEQKMKLWRLHPELKPK